MWMETKFAYKQSMDWPQFQVGIREDLERSRSGVLRLNNDAGWRTVKTTQTTFMQRPTSVTVFGVLNIVFAAFGVLGLIGTIVMFAMMDASRNPVVKMMQNNPAYAVWMKVSLPLGLAATVVLLTTGIGLLRMKSWARKLAIGYAIYAIAFSILGTAVNFIFFMRPMLEEASRKQGPEAAGAIAGAVGGTAGECLGIIYPILLLIFMTRPKVVAAFQASAAPPVIPPG
jgi:hypothetical protein